LEDLIPIIDGLRNKRKIVGDVLFSVLRTEGEKEKEEFCTNCHGVGALRRDGGKAHKKA